MNKNVILALASKKQVAKAVKENMDAQCIAIDYTIKCIENNILSELIDDFLKVETQNKIVNISGLPIDDIKLITEYYNKVSNECELLLTKKVRF